MLRKFRAGHCESFEGAGSGRNGRGERGINPTTLMAKPAAQAPPGRPRPLSGRARSTLVGLIGGLGALLLALVPLKIGSRPHPGVETTLVELLKNGGFEGRMEGWGPAG